MDVYFPDIIGEYMDAPQRFETGGLQYAGYFESTTLAPEQVGKLFLFVQNTFNAPMTVVLKVEPPKTKGFFQSKPVLRVEQPQLQLKLAAAEAGLLTLPVTTTEAAEPGDYELTLVPQVSFKDKGQRVRASKSQSQLKSDLFDSLVGLDLVSTLGATFVTRSVKKTGFPIKIAGEPAPSERAPRLKHTYETIWKQDEINLFNKSVQEINSRETKIQSELTVDGLYTNLYSETVRRFADASLPLRIGEAIMLAKILTYSCQFFLSSAERRNGLLVPIWQRALAGDMDTTHTLDVIRVAGYYHLLKLAVMLSFGVVAQAVGRQFWSLRERQAVTHLVADTLEAGDSLDLDFLYLPLLMGGTHISNRFKLEGEDPRHSLALIRKARDARFDLFTDAATAQADKIYDHILKKARAA